ncbi:MAG: class I SAM-dependent methyltransferase [Bacteroidetes bacterium]|nr:class I SAM-dependent methyltransferase [Bacteroidota bacterium]
MKIIENNYRIEHCPLCSSKTIYKTGDLKYANELYLSTIRIQLTQQPELWECKLCQSSFTQNAIPPQIAEELYSIGEGSKRWANQSFETDKTDAVINYFKKNKSFRNKKLLDVGCNTGEFLDFASSFQMQTYGLEICKESCTILKQKGHIAFQSFRDVNETFDIVTAFDVFEHLYDVKGFLSFVSNILKPSGLFILLTGNPNSFAAKLSRERWWYCNYPEHVIYPSKKYFHQLTGFFVKQIILTYASKTHQSKRDSMEWISLIRQILKKQYNGLPAISSDHQLVILQKNIA